jgi:ParB-like chromosome segregation protein Spo0J
MPSTIIINPELQSFLPPLSAALLADLEQKLLREGCVDPLRVWQGTGILLDGHHRFTLCQKHGIAYTTVAVEIEDLDDAKLWMITHQDSRRNWTPDERSYYIGKQYELEKKRVGRPGKNGEKGAPLRTDERLAYEHQVTRRTIHHDAAYARNVDEVAEAVGPEARQAILARDAKVGRKEVQHLADIAEHSPQTAKHVIEKVQEAATPKEAKRIVQDAVRATSAGAPESAARPMNEHTPELTLPLSLNGPSAANVTAWRLTLVVEQISRLAPLVGMPLVPALDPEGDAYLALCEGIETVVDAVVARLTAPPLVEAPARAKPRARPAKGKRRRKVSLTQRVTEAIRGRASFTCPEIAEALHEKPKYVWAVLDKLVKQADGPLRKQGDTYVSLICSPD